MVLLPPAGPERADRDRPPRARPPSAAARRGRAGRGRAASGSRRRRRARRRRPRPRPSTWPCCHCTSETTVAANSTQSPARVRLPGALARAGDRQAGKQRQADRRRRGDVADVPLEGDRLALLAGRGQRGEDVGDRGEQDDGAEHPDQRLGAAPERVDAGAEEGGDRQRPEEAERLVEAGEEPVRPDPGVGPVVEDREARAAARRPARAPAGRAARSSCTGSGCRPRSGCAGTSSRRRRRRGARTRRRRGRGATPGDHGDADEQGKYGGEEGELGAGREARRDAGDGERRGRRARSRHSPGDS